MKHLILVITLLTLGCSNNAEENSVDMQPDIQKDLSNNQPIKDMNSNIDLYPDTDDLSVSDMIDMQKMHKPFKYNGDQEIVNCNDHCASVQLACDGEYFHPAFLKIGGTSDYGNSGLALNCEKIPPIELDGQKLISVTCYCR